MCLPPGDSVVFMDEVGNAGPAVSPAGSVDQLLGVVRLLLSEGLVSRVGACFHFQISSSDGECQSYYVDLSQGGWSLWSWARTLMLDTASLCLKRKIKALKMKG